VFEPTDAEVKALAVTLKGAVLPAAKPVTRRFVAIDSDIEMLEVPDDECNAEQDQAQGKVQGQGARDVSRRLGARGVR
jgi:hypothetical protein